MFLRMAALGEGVIGIALKEELNCGYEVVFGLGTIRVYQCRQGRKERRVFGSTCKQSGNVGEELGTDLIYVSVRETSYLSGGKEDVHACISALILGLKSSKGEASQSGHEWSTCCRPVIVPCLFITRRTPLMP